MGFSWPIHSTPSSALNQKLYCECWTESNSYTLPYPRLAYHGAIYSLPLPPHHLYCSIISINFRGKPLMKAECNQLIRSKYSV